MIENAFCESRFCMVWPHMSTVMLAIKKGVAAENEKKWNDLKYSV